MSAVPKTSDHEIVAAGRAILEELGEQALTMQRVAERVGIRGPSLYKRYADREALLKAIESDTFRELTIHLKQDSHSSMAMVNAYLDFARAHPACYRLLFRSGMPDEARKAVEPLLEILQRFLPRPQDLLVRARLITSFLHGYAMMETAGAFRLGGDPREAIKLGLALILPEDPSLGQYLTVSHRQ